MNYVSLLSQKKKLIAIITGAFILLSLVLSLIHPLEYSATNRLLVIQPTNIGLDAYSATKSVERIGEKLSEVVYTTSFYDKVMSSNFDIQKGYFKTDERKKRKQWARMIDTQVIRGSGMLKISVYHTNKAQAAQLLNAITHVFHDSGWEYVGSMNIQITEVDSPLISKWPVRPNFILNGLIGLILGLIVSCVYVGLASKHYKLSEVIRRAIKSINVVDGNVADLGKDESKFVSSQPMPTQQPVVQEQVHSMNDSVDATDEIEDFNLFEDLEDSPRRVSMQAIDLDRF